MLKRTLLAAFTIRCFGLFAAAQAADPLVPQTKWLADAQSAGFYVAQAKGFYKQAGLDVTILPGGPDITPSEVLAGGKADVAVDWMPSALAVRDKGAPLVNIAQMFQHSGLQLACRRDSGIRRPADFKGKRLGVWYAGNEYPFLAWMAKLGDPAKLERLARFLRASVAGWRYAAAPAHEAETLSIVLRNASPSMTDRAHQQRMLRAVARLIPGSRRGLGYLETADYQRTVDVLSSAASIPVAQKPEGAWTHAVWKKAFPRQTAGAADPPSAATPVTR